MELGRTVDLAAALVGSPLRTLRRATLWWSAGLAALVGLTIAFWPAFRGSSGISQAIEQLPPSVVQAFGLADFGTPAGFLRGNLYELIVPLLLVGAAVALVTGQTASAEAAGRLELFLAQPVDRGAVFLGRALGTGIALAVIAVVTLVVQLFSGPLVGLSIAAWLVTGTIVLCFLLAGLFGAIAYLIAAATGRSGLTLGVAIGLAIAGYLVAALFPLSDPLASWRHLSPWDWAFGGNPLEHPTEPWRYLAVGLPAIALLTIGTAVVRRRDIAAA
jgi:beta-exotoxin I transport system permease protein